MIEKTGMLRPVPVPVPVHGTKDIGAGWQKYNANQE